MSFRPHDSCHVLPYCTVYPSIWVLILGISAIEYKKRAKLWGSQKINGRCGNREAMLFLNPECILRLPYLHIYNRENDYDQKIPFAKN